MSITVPQNLLALDHANTVRLDQSDLKRECREGLLSPVEALADKRASSLRIGVLLCAFPRMGVKKVERVLREANYWHKPIHPHRKVCELTMQERRMIARCMPSRCKLGASEQ